MMIKILLLKSVPVRAETKQHCLQLNFQNVYTLCWSREAGKIEVVNADETGIGGMKEVEFMVKGQGAYSVMKYESGVHRVQRVPETESGGRIHTSTASVAVMPGSRRS